MPLHYAILASFEQLHDFLYYERSEDDSDLYVEHMKGGCTFSLDNIDTRVRMLLEHGADSSAADDYGRTALSIASEIEPLKGTQVYWRLHDLQFE